MTDHRAYAPATDLGVNRTLSAAIVDRLRENIILGELRPGERLWQDRLAERFGVSRIPIREALRQLSAEGLVTLQSHKSAEVARLSTVDIEEVFTISGTLEAVGAERGAALLTPADVEELGRLLDEMRRAEGDPPVWYRFNLEFHSGIIGPSGWNRLQRLVEESRRNLFRYIVTPGFHEAHVRDWHTQHVAIHEACRAGDAARVRTMVEHHWRYASGALRSHLAEIGEATAAG